MGSGKRALVIVDVQPTFCEGGELGVDGGNAVAQKIADFVRAHRSDYDLIVTTQDWHIDPGDHFSTDPDFIDTWPPHGLAGTANAELHPALADLAPDVSVKKGEFAAAYSGFEGAQDGVDLATILHRERIEDIDVIGIAESHCVKQTALDGVAGGFAVRVFTDLTVPVSPALGAQAREAMDEAGVELLPSGAGL